MKITFPNKTALEIMVECGNKLGNGKLLWNPTGWYETEDFYTKEKCRPRTVEVGNIEHFGKSWDWCKETEEKQNLTHRGIEMLNMAETLWFLLEYWKEYKFYPPDAPKWSWTSSRSSGGYLVRVGDCDSDGVGVSDDDPGYSGSYLGVRFSRSVATLGAEPEQGAADSLELAIKTVKEAGYVIFKPI